MAGRLGKALYRTREWQILRALCKAAGVTDRLWEIADIVSLIDAKSEVAA